MPNYELLAFYPPNRKVDRRGVGTESEELCFPFKWDANFDPGALHVIRPRPIPNNSLRILADIDADILRASRVLKVEMQDGRLYLIPFHHLL
jgi:hypothetical protein